MQGNPELVPDHPAQTGIVFHPREPDFGADFFSDGEQFLLGGAHADLIVKIQPSQRVQHITAQLVFDPVQLFGSPANRISVRIFSRMVNNSCSVVLMLISL